MKIGVVSDTHSQGLPQQMVNDFKTVDFIIHAGDFCELTDYETLAKIKEVKGVQGNMDNEGIREKFPPKQIILCGRYHIGVYHGTGPPGAVLDRVKEEFEDNKVDVVVFGHSHRPLNAKIGNVLYFNPGSPTDSINAPYCSYGILKVTDKEIKGSIIKVKD